MSSQESVVSTEEILSLLSNNKKATFFMNLKQTNSLVSIPAVGVITENENKRIASPVAAQIVLPKELVIELRNKSVQNLVPYSAFKSIGLKLANSMQRKVILNLVNDINQTTSITTFFPTKK